MIFVQYQVGLIEYLKPALEFSRAEAEGTVLRSLPTLDFSGGAVAAQVNWEAWLFYLFYAMPLVSLWLAWRRARAAAASDGRANQQALRRLPS